MPAPLESTMFAIIPSQPEIGDTQAKVWPHISVIPWVQLDGYRNDVLAEAQDIVKSRMPLDLKPGGMTVVGGEGHEKPAQRIISEQLRELHTQLLYCLGSFGIMVSHPEWAGSGYRPHITSPHKMLLARTAVDALYVVDNVQLKRGERGTKLISMKLTKDGYEI